MEHNHTAFVQSNIKGILQKLQQVTQQYFKRELSLQEYYQKQQQQKLQLHHIKLLKNKIFEISQDDLNDSQTKQLKQDISKIRKIRSQQESDKIKLDQYNKYQKDYKHISILKYQINQNNKQIPLILEKQISSVYKNKQIKLLRTKTEKYNEMINNLNDRVQGVISQKRIRQFNDIITKINQLDSNALVNEQKMLLLLKELMESSIYHR